MKERIKPFSTPILLFIAFIIFTVLVKVVDVRSIGPEGSMVGFSHLNESFRGNASGNDFCYVLTEILGYMSIAIMCGFALLGLLQLIKRKSLKKVDFEIWCLAGFYVLVLAFYAFFEKVIINYRPIIEDAEKGLEASYPSSHMMLIICTISSAATALVSMTNGRNANLKNILFFLECIVILVAIIGRALSGVHWLTDIIGGALLAFALSLFFRATVVQLRKKYKAK